MPENCLHKELRVTGTAEQASITPISGKKLRIHAMFISMTVTVALTSTLRASVSLGTDHVTDSSKVLWCERKLKGDDTAELWMNNLNILGNTDETVTLTNTTFSNGSVITRAVIYYEEV